MVEGVVAAPHATLQAAGLSAEVEQLMDLRERWFIHRQGRCFGEGLPLASASAAARAYARQPSSSRWRWHAPRTHHVVEENYVGANRGDGDGLHVYPLEEFSNAPVGATSQQGRYAQQAAGASETTQLQPTVDSVVLQRKRLGVIIETAFIHRKRFALLPYRSATLALHDHAEHRTWFAAHRRGLCDKLRLRHVHRCM